MNFFSASFKRRLAWVWALPLSLPGLLLWLWLRKIDGKQSCRISGLRGCPIFIACGSHAGRWLERYPFFDAQALTIGCVILAYDEQTLKRCLTHELAHVQQGFRWGLFFPVLYLASSLWQWLRGRDAYYQNAFERDAFRLEELMRKRRQRKQSPQTIRSQGIGGHPQPSASTPAI